jgi:hypothetical protein
LTDSEVDAAEAALRATSLADLAESCLNPAQARLALRWLSRTPQGLRATIGPAGVSFGPVLAVLASQGTVLTPAALISEMLIAASARLAEQASSDRDSRRTLRAFTSFRVEGLLEGPARIATTGRPRSDAPFEEDPTPRAADWSGDFPGFVSDAFSGVITSYLDPREFGQAIGRARESADCVTTELAHLAGRDLAANVPRVVIYGGLPTFTEPIRHDSVLVHVEELAEMLADTVGDLDPVAQFLREVSSHPGSPGVVFIDVLDAWWHWRDQELIGPLFPEGNGIAVLPYDGRPDWDRAGAREPIEEVLAGAGMPSCDRWAAVRLDEPGQATLFWPPPNRAGVVLVRADPPLVVMVFFDDGPALGMTPDWMYGLADGIRITAGRDPAITDFLRLPGGVPVTCTITLTPERQPSRDEGDSTGIGLAADPERHRIALQLGPEFFELLIGNSAEGHEMLGWALRHAMEALRAPGSGEADRATAFLDAWNAAPPVMMASRYKNTGPAAMPLDPLPADQSARARALRTIAIEVQAAEPPAGPLGERDVLRHFAEVTETVLRRRLSKCDLAVVEDVAAALNAATSAGVVYGNPPRDLFLF